jgi:hypothetical protein
MLSQAVLVLTVTSFVIVTLIFSLYSAPDVFARIKYGNIICLGGVGEPGATIGKVGCCQTQTDTKSGLEIKYCTICDDTQPPSNCGPRYEARASSQGSLSPGGNTTIPPSTGKLPPGNIIKASPGTLNTLTPTGNNTNSSIARAAGVYSPTGGCSTGSKVKCIPCDPGIKSPYCIPSSEWPTSAAITGLPAAGLTNNGPVAGTPTTIPPGVFKPTGNLTGVLPTGNNTGTSQLPPTLLAKQPSSSSHHQQNGGTSSSNTASTSNNSTGH